MPIIEKSTYKSPKYFQNTHINTLYPAILRTVKNIDYQRMRVNTQDGDFFDLDWTYALNNNTRSKRLLICVHGLEGHARRPYMAGMMKRFNTEGYDAVGLNMRGCSGEDNLLLSSYHSGFTKDLAFLVDSIAEEAHYEEVIIVGFSVGGNIVMKYAGEKGAQIPKIVKKIITFSVPCDLESGSIEFEKPHNRFYQWQFLVTLKQKARAKFKKFPQSFNLEAALKAKYFRQFDDHFTAPINGFKDAVDYWHKASSLPYLPHICVPTLLVNATNDTFLGKTCFPIEFAEKSPLFYLEMPPSGGHLGFMSPDTEGYLWTEHRAIDFVFEAI